METGKPELDKDNFPDIDDMVSVCAGFMRHGFVELVQLRLRALGVIRWIAAVEA